MIIVSKEYWDSLDVRAKGIWQSTTEMPEWNGRQTVMGNCISDDPEDIGSVLVEGIHFTIK